MHSFTLKPRNYVQANNICKTILNYLDTKLLFTASTAFHMKEPMFLDTTVGTGANLKPAYIEEAPSIQHKLRMQK